MGNDNLENRLDSEIVPKPHKVSSINKAVEQVEKYEERLEKVQEASDAKKDKLQQSRKKWFKVIFITIVLIIISLWVIPHTRNYIVNIFGARTTLKIITREQQEQGALVTLKNVEVQVNGQTYTAKDSNELEIKNQKYGVHTVRINKNGYEQFEEKLTANFDPFFGLFSWEELPTLYAHLKLTGATITFTAKDWLSDKPISSGEFTVGDRTAKPINNGKVSIVTPPSDVKSISVSASFDGEYLDKKFDIDPSKQNQEVTFIPAQRHYFSKKDAAELNVYSSYIDGSDQKLCIKGTGNDTEIQFAVRSDGKYAVMVSTREGVRDENATLLQKVYWVDLSTCSIESVDSGQFIRLNDWLGESITYTAAYREAKIIDLKWRLRSFDTSTKNSYDLATASGFIGTVFSVHDTAVFTKAEIGAHTDAAKNTTLHLSGKKASDKRELASNVEELLQLDHQRFAYKVSGGQWSEVNINTGEIKPSQPSNVSAKVFIATPNKHGDRVFVEINSSGRTLKLQTIDVKTNKTLVTGISIKGPIRFLNQTTLTYRIGSVDYAVSTLGDQPKKIADVVPTTPAAGMLFSFN